MNDMCWKQTGFIPGDRYHLNEKQKEMIREGKQQIARGEYISEQELEKEEEEWLSKNFCRQVK